MPDNGLISVRAISASDFLCGERYREDYEIVHRPAQTYANHQPQQPGQNPNCAASTGPISGPAPEMAAK